MKVFHSDRHPLPLPAAHRFPIAKYEMTRALLVAEGWVSPSELHDSPMATEAELSLAHTPGYIRAVRDGTLDAAAVRKLGFPWSPELYRRSAATVGGCIAAARAALEDGVSGNLAGGTHHAHADFGAGYCVFNDIAVAALKLLREGRVKRVAVVDLDVHQGDGNAAILGSEPGVFIFSMHGEKNFPFEKPPSTLDIGLKEGATDHDYLTHLVAALPMVFTHDPDLIFYQAGVDPLKDDKLGKLSLTFDGLMARDRIVLEGCKKRGIPVALSLGGGYADPIELSVRAYANTYRMVREVFAKPRAGRDRRPAPEASL